MGRESVRWRRLEADGVAARSAIASKATRTSRVTSSQRPSGPRRRRRGRRGSQVHRRAQRDRVEGDEDVEGHKFTERAQRDRVEGDEDDVESTQPRTEPLEIASKATRTMSRPQAKDRAATRSQSKATRTMSRATSRRPEIIGQPPGMADPGLTAALQALRQAARRSSVAQRFDAGAEQALLQTIVDATVALFEGEASSIALFERDLDRLEFRVAAGAQGAGAIGLSVPPSRGIVGFASTSRAAARAL